MFMRKNKNRSGTVSVQVVSKKQGEYRVVKTLGSSGNPDGIKRLELQAYQFMECPEGQQRLMAVESPEAVTVEIFVRSLRNAQIRTKGPEIVFGTLFDRIGFNVLPHDLFRHIVIARLAFPTSKRKTVDYLYRFSGKQVSESALYRFLDTLQADYKDRVERVAFEQTKKTLGGISVVFYDMTTLYFEAEDEDDLRKIGFSKDGKFQQPQIMIGLLVGKGGYPIGYDIFEGNTFEGHTLIPVLENIEKKYDLGKPTVVADAGLLSRQNTKKLTEAGYHYILGARIKKEIGLMKEKILEWAHDHRVDGQRTALAHPDMTRLVLSYTDKRAKKDRYNRERGMKKLRAKVASGRLSKKHVVNRGYNKFLQLEGKVTVSINEAKVQEDERWDGLKGYVTNTNLDPAEVMSQYADLWQIEEAFRISKSDLRVRPIFHRLRRRIEAHLCIAFVAYVIWKELERLLKKHHLTMSPRRAGELTQNMYEIFYEVPEDPTSRSFILGMDDDQQLLYDVILKS
jgi:transposase